MKQKQGVSSIKNKCKIHLYRCGTNGLNLFASSKKDLWFHKSVILIHSTLAQPGTCNMDPNNTPFIQTLI